MEDWQRNVGTPNHPVTWLHERAVALIYDMLTSDGGDVRARLSPDDDALSPNLAEGVTRIELAEDDPLMWVAGGLNPDIRCFGDDGRLVRVIEVTHSAEPDEGRRKKWEQLKRRDVDVVEIKINDLDSLRYMFWRPAPVEFFPSIKVKGATSATFRKNQSSYDFEVEKLTRALMLCSPKVRRNLQRVLDNLNTVDSLYPLTFDNPLAEKLEQAQPDIRRNPDQAIMNDPRFRDYWPK